MDKDQIKIIISEYQQLVRDIVLIPRHYPIENSQNYVMVGVRRAGKSFLMYQQAQKLLKQGHRVEEILYFNFEDDRLTGLCLSDLDLIKSTYEEMYPYKPIFFLDEIQNIDHWEKFVRRLADQQYRIYVTGSNAKMLSREIATTLGGRFLMLEVYPFDLQEYLKVKGLSTDDPAFIYKQRTQILREFTHYLTYGGFPEVINVQDKRGWLSSLYNKIFFGDIVTRYGIRNEYALKILVKKLAESLMQPSSFRRLTNIVTSAGKKISTDTVIDYVGYLQESWLTFSLSNFNDNLTEKESNKKYYFIDNGILSLFLLSPKASLLENIVAIHLRARYGADVFYYNKNIEVDFYVPAQSLAIQVCTSINDPETRHREVKALASLSNHIDLSNALIITLDNDEEIQEGPLTIRVIPAWRWLLES